MWHIRKEPIMITRFFSLLVLFLFVFMLSIGFIAPLGGSAEAQDDDRANPLRIKSHWCVVRHRNPQGEDLCAGRDPGGSAACHRGQPGQPPRESVDRCQ